MVGVQSPENKTNGKRGGKESELHACANVNGGVEMTIVLRMVVVDHLEKVVVVTRAEGLVKGAVEGLA